MNTSGFSTHKRQRRAKKCCSMHEACSDRLSSNWLRCLKSPRLLPRLLSAVRFRRQRAIARHCSCDFVSDRKISQCTRTHRLAMLQVRVVRCLMRFRRSGLKTLSAIAFIEANETDDRAERNGRVQCGYGTDCADEREFRLSGCFGSGCCLLTLEKWVPVDEDTEVVSEKDLDHPCENYFLQ
mgnify:FL=1